MVEPYLWVRVKLEQAVTGASDANIGRPCGYLVSRNSPVAGLDTSPIGRVSGSGLSRAWVVFEPPPPPATERV